MRFKVRSGAKPFLTHITFMRSFSGMYVVVFLQMGQLCKALPTRLAFKRPLAGVRSQMYFQVGQLTERLAAYVAFVVHFSVFLADRIGQRSVPTRVTGAAGTSAR